jgi:hypothetical protein
MSAELYWGPQIVSNTARTLVVANWPTVCGNAFLTGMKVPGLPAPKTANIYTSRRAQWTAEQQPAFGLTVLRTTSEIIDALGAMDQLHELEVSVNADWGYYDSNGTAQPLTSTAPFTEEVYETCLRTYIEGILLILTSPVYGLVNYDARNQNTPQFVQTGIFNCLPGTGVTPTDFAVGLDDTGQTVIQQTVRATILVHQRRGIAR